MDAKTIRLRLSGHGDLTAHQDGSFTLGLTRLWGESWGARLKKAVVDEVPGARVRVVRCRRLKDRMFERHEVVFRVGPEPARHDALLVALGVSR